MEIRKQKQEIDTHIRPAQETDIPFILNSWLKSFRMGTFNVNVANTIYFTEQHKLVEKILKRSTVLIACESNDVANIYGYIVFEKIEGILTIHYMYIKHTFRGLGLSKVLLENAGHDKEAGGLYTHNTRVGEKVAIKANLVYHPYLLINTEGYDA